MMIIPWPWHTPGYSDKTRQINKYLCLNNILGKIEKQERVSVDGRRQGGGAELRNKNMSGLSRAKLRPAKLANN